MCPKCLSLNFVKNGHRSITIFLKEEKLLEEYRTRLIADVVTGKVDVRGIKVEDVAEEELPVCVRRTGRLDNLSDTETSSTYAYLSAVPTAQAEASLVREE
ncbi:MAG: restriction endonuclease subunit S [Candidatus Scalindua sp.]